MIIWDFEMRAVYAKLVLHRNSVEAVSFTYNDKYLVSLGGQDDARCYCQQRHCVIQTKFNSTAGQELVSVLAYVTLRPYWVPA